MSQLKDYLQKYKSTPNIDDFAKTKKKKKKPKNASTFIIDEDDDAREWGQRVESDEDPMVDEGAAATLDFESNFKSSNWEVVREGERRRSPSLSPEPRPSRRSPSASPPRTRRTSPSPSPERGRHSVSAEQSQISAHDGTAETKKELRMSDGTLAGLQSGKALRQQLQQQREREHHFQQPAEEQTTVYRDKSGKKVDLEAQKRELLEEKQRRALEEEKRAELGRGLVQKREQEERERRLLAERERGLAVYADDVDRNAELRQRARWGDTMASLVSTKSKQSRRATYQGPTPAPNRFNIAPGYRWDGVDRSNGWELKLFRSQHELAERKADYHRWAAEDM
ncbi:Pre-mRNA-splicing factor cwc26 [Kappamyces sp. JEL0680]|nr:Pre-mRNA-splicing factor cwc26 [Kappamyces sp. JEL0680]